jgi:hypothetical protein
MLEVREMTSSSPSCPSVAMISSVIPSAKYSCEGSPERFASGSTAIERIAPGATTAVRESRSLGHSSAASASTAAIAATTSAIGRHLSVGVRACPPAVGGAGHRRFVEGGDEIG